MKRMFVRGLWGDENVHSRKYNTNREMRQILDNKFNEKFITYVFGKENFKLAESLGHECVLINENPFPYDSHKEHYRHKLEIFSIAMHDYDEMVYMDWDCIPQKKLPIDFWDVMGKKEVIQANLGRYKKRKALWRKPDGRNQSVIPNAGFVYIRDKSIPEKIIKAWEILDNKASAEPPMAKVMDDMTNGWCGNMKYWELFEPEFCNIRGRSPFPSSMLNMKNVCFMHYHGGKTRK